MLVLMVVLEDLLSRAMSPWAILHMSYLQQVYLCLKFKLKLNLAVLPSQVNQAFPVSFPNTLYALGNYEMPNAGTFQDKEKENAFLAQQQAQHQQFNGQPPQQGPRNDMFYGLPQQNFNQGFRNQFHQQGFPGQFPTAGNFMVPPHKYHNNNQPNNNFRLH